MSAIGSIHSLWRYPIKTLLGECLPTIAIDNRGVVGDRLFAIVNHNGTPIGKWSKQVAKINHLFTLEAAYQNNPKNNHQNDTPLIRTADGNTLTNEQINDFLSQLLEQDVTLKKEHTACYFDDSPVHILTTTELKQLRANLPNCNIDERRFRPNIIIDSADDINNWVGKTITIGKVTLEITQRTKRCVMTTLAQSELPQQADILRWLAANAQQCFGVYARVIKTGSVHQNDSVQLN